MALHSVRGHVFGDGLLHLQLRLLLNGGLDGFRLQLRIGVFGDGGLHGLAVHLRVDVLSNFRLHSLAGHLCRDVFGNLGLYGLAAHLRLDGGIYGILGLLGDHPGGHGGVIVCLAHVSGSLDYLLRHLLLHGIGHCGGDLLLHGCCYLFRHLLADGGGHFRLDLLAHGLGDLLGDDRPLGLHSVCDLLQSRLVHGGFIQGFDQGVQLLGIVFNGQLRHVKALSPNLRSGGLQ